MDTTDDWIGLPAAAAMAKVSESTLRRMIQAGRLEAKTISWGKRTRILIQRDAIFVAFAAVMTAPAGIGPGAVAAMRTRREPAATAEALVLQLQADLARVLHVLAGVRAELLTVRIELAQTRTELLALLQQNQDRSSLPLLHSPNEETSPAPAPPKTLRETLFGPEKVWPAYTGPLKNTWAFQEAWGDLQTILKTAVKKGLTPPAWENFGASLDDIEPDGALTVQELISRGTEFLGELAKMKKAASREKLGLWASLLSRANTALGRLKELRK